MKKTLLLIMLLIGALIVQAKTIEQEVRYLDSYEIAGNNLTLIGIGNDKKSIVICVNNERSIIERGNEIEISNLKIEPLTIYDLSAKLKLIYSDEDRECDESCSNTACLGSVAEEIEEVQAEEIEEVQAEEIEEPRQPSNFTSISLGLMILAVVLLIIFFSKKKR
ncbi:hypothetical protein J4425_00795 [Candidatus Woesearchaeota archaeon]|nr:hypothetical protein [Candidatus Woesearchaeota archaeon]